MLTEEEIGKKIVESVWINKKHSDLFFEGLQKRLSKLKVKTTKETTKLYDKILFSLDLKDGLVENSVGNLSKVSKLMSGLEKIQVVYKKKYGELTRSAKEENWILLKDREDAITRLLEKVNIKEQSRTAKTKENKALLKLINRQGYKRVNQIIEKWKNFVYDTFYIGVTRGMGIADFKNLFYTDSGALKIGSTLSETEIEAMITITEERTAFLQQRAKELDYKCCWNSNPMDMRTKAECASASLAGVVTEAAMGTDYGFPPRFLCRCELVYTRCEWKGVNKGVNEAIAERRLHLLEELRAAPNQMAKWKKAGTWIIPKEELRAAGAKPYKEIEDKIKLIEKIEVPEFIYENLKEAV